MNHEEKMEKKIILDFKSSVLRSILCDYNDAYKLLSGTITITWANADDESKRLDEINKGVIFRNYSKTRLL